MGVFQPVSTTPKGGITSIDFQSDFPSSWKPGLEDLPIAAYNRWLELKTHFQHDHDYSVQSTEYLGPRLSYLRPRLCNTKDNARQAILQVSLYDGIGED